MSTALKLVSSRSTFPAPAHEHGTERAWSLAQLSGRLSELSSIRAGAQLTFALRLVLEAQQSGETPAWIGGCNSSFFPPDAEGCGIDLAALPVMRLATAQEMGRAADQLLRSGAFGLVVLDLGTAPLAAPLLTRLLGLAQKHFAAVLFLTEKPSETPSLSSLISLRVVVGNLNGSPRQAKPAEPPLPFAKRLLCDERSSQRGVGAAAVDAVDRVELDEARLSLEEPRFVCELRALKDKRRAPGWTHSEEFRGPAGLR